MNVYKVHISEVLSRDVIVRANSETEAEEIVYEGIVNGRISLNNDNSEFGDSYIECVGKVSKGEVAEAIAVNDLIE